MKPKILFASPCGPYPKLPIESDPIDFFYYRNTYKQKMFQLRSFQSWHSLHFLAQNIAVPSVVLENATMRQFQKEIKKGDYEVLAIGFTVLLTKRVLEMVEWTKRYKPSIEVVLGGYGTAIFKESFTTSDQLKSLSDHICFGEGLGFLNTLISKKWGIPQKIKLVQDLLPAVSSFYRTRITIFKQIVVASGLGCTYGCSFCATSSHFNKQYVSLFKGKQLVDVLQKQATQHPDIQSAIIYDEDFLANRSSVIEFMHHFEASGLNNRPFFLTIFASMKSILNYTIEELIRCGIGTIFIGVESLNEKVLGEEGLLKRKGDIEKLFAQLHEHGINTLGSLIVGWDSQTKAIMRDDANRFVAMNPTFYQIVPLHAIPGTQLWEKLKSENRIDSEYHVENDGISDFNFNLKNTTRDEALNVISSSYSALVNEGGPWPFRMFENLLNGYLNLKESNKPVLANRARNYRPMLFPIGLLAVASRLLFSGSEYSRRWKVVMKKYFKLLPNHFLFSLFLAPLVSSIIIIIYAFGSTRHYLLRKGDQPNFIRKLYTDDEKIELRS